MRSALYHQQPLSVLSEALLQVVHIKNGGDSCGCRRRRLAEGVHRRAQYLRGDDATELR